MTRDPPSNLEKLQTAVGSLSDMLGQVKLAAQANAAGGSGDILAQAISDTLAVIPDIEGDEFKALLDSYVQDVLVSVYLGNLAASQVEMGERMHSLPMGGS